MSGHFCSRSRWNVSRRQFISGAALGAVGGAALGAGGYAWLRPDSQASIVADGAGLPGRYPGRVVEVNRPGTVLPTEKVLYHDWRGPNIYHRRDEAAVEQMVAQGMRKLVGGDNKDITAVEAWKSFFQPGDCVGIKIVPVGCPDSISSFELVRAIIAGLESAGVRKQNVLVFERYRDEFLNCQYHRQLPEGVHWEASSVRYDDAQLEIDGQLPKMPKVSHVAGYDRDVYREFAFSMPDPIHDPHDDRRFRSHLSKIITQKVDKFISIPVLKDHRSAGVTLALKNLSHGSVNNVCRSHIIHSGRTNWSDDNHGGRTLNQCQTFIPAIASLPEIREKAVLQILDGLVGTYEGGPGNWNPTHGVWNYDSLFFATDPVALDHVGWKIIDEKRRHTRLSQHSGRKRVDQTEASWPPVAQMGLDSLGGAVPLEKLGSTEQLHMRQPQHIPLAATLGLGTFHADQIKYERLQASS